MGTEAAAVTAAAVGKEEAEGKVAGKGVAANVSPCRHYSVEVGVRTRRRVQGDERAAGPDRAVESACV